MNENENRHESGSRDNFSKHSNETKNNPKTPSNYLHAILAVVIILAFVAWFGSSGNSGAAQSNYNQQPQSDYNQQPQKTCRDVQVPYDYLEEYSETVPYTDRVCENKDLPYSIDQFIMTNDVCNKAEDECHKWFLGLCTDKTTFCVDKTVSCSLILKNLDNEQSGVWVTKFGFRQVGTSNDIKTEDVSSSLYPQTQEAVVGTARIQSSGTTGDANKDITCVYQTTTIPTKQVCRDVIKYKEVTKTRTVTRYRTENKCE